MTKPAPSLLAALLIGAVLFMAVPAVALDGPTLSRYHVTANPVTPVVNLNQGVLETLCRDEDGCEVVMTLESTLEVVPSDDWIEAQRFGFNMALFGAHLAWSKGATGVDNDNVKNIGGLVQHVDGTMQCEFNDADGVLGTTDSGVGFSLVLTGANLTCNMVLID